MKTDLDAGKNFIPFEIMNLYQRAAKKVSGSSKISSTHFPNNFILYMRCYALLDTVAAI